jgi:hypothetical protein
MPCRYRLEGKLAPVAPGAAHETLKILFQENPDVGDTFSAGKNKLWIAVRLPSGSCEEDQKP